MVRTRNTRQLNNPKKALPNSSICNDVETYMAFARACHTYSHEYNPGRGASNARFFNHVARAFKASTGCAGQISATNASLICDDLVRWYDTEFSEPITPSEPHDPPTYVDIWLAFHGFMRITYPSRAQAHPQAPSIVPAHTTAPTLILAPPLPVKKARNKGKVARSRIEKPDVRQSSDARAKSVARETVAGLGALESAAATSRDSIGQLLQSLVSTSAQTNAFLQSIIEQNTAIATRMDGFCHNALAHLQAMATGLCHGSHDSRLISVNTTVSTAAGNRDYENFNLQYAANSEPISTRNEHYGGSGYEQSTNPPQDPADERIRQHHQTSDSDCYSQVSSLDEESWQDYVGETRSSGRLSEIQQAWQSQERSSRAIDSNRIASLESDIEAGTPYLWQIPDDFAAMDAYEKSLVHRKAMGYYKRLQKTYRSSMARHRAVDSVKQAIEDIISQIDNMVESQRTLDRENCRGDSAAAKRVGSNWQNFDILDDWMEQQGWILDYWGTIVLKVEIDSRKDRGETLQSILDRLETDKAQMRQQANLSQEQQRTKYHQTLNEHKAIRKDYQNLLEMAEQTGQLELAAEAGRELDGFLEQLARYDPDPPQNR